MKVAVYKSETGGYCEVPPYHPPERYPELAAKGFRETQPANGIYGAVRNTLRLLGLDAPRQSGPEWNPLGEYVRPGARVLLKPNLVLHEHGVQIGQRCLTTHGSVIRAMVDYAFLAGGPESKIAIADAPVQGADFAKLVAQNGLDAIRDFYWSTFRFEIEVLDLRQVYAVLDEQSSLIVRVEEGPGDPRGARVRPAPRRCPARSRGSSSIPARPTRRRPGRPAGAASLRLPADAPVPPRRRRL